jgi:hypothetical protein
MAVVQRDFQIRDEVKHAVQDVTGTIMAKYPDPKNPSSILIDIRFDEEHIYYGTRAANWILVKAVEDIE